MESSSNDSFLWADASNDSSDNEKNKIIVKSMKTKYKDEPDTSANYKQKECEKNLGTENENEPKKMQLKSKKRKCSETVQENSDYPIPEKKRIKLEPESDIDIEKKKKSRKDINTQDSVEYEEYFNLKVKQEETSLVQTKKKKKKKTSNSHIENASQSDSSIEPNRESFEKDLRIKQEQVSVVEPEIVKSKKKKKHKRSNVSSDTEIASEAKSVTTISEVTVPDELSKLDEPSKYSIIEEKFFAEENVVEKPRKNKRKKIAAESNNIDDDNKSTVSDDLRIRVKQEETSLVQTKEKKKKKTSNSHIENKSQSDSSIEPNRESIEKNLRVKQEQASVVEPEIVKSKKKKKYKRSNVSSDTEIASEAKSVTTISEVTVPDELSKLDEPSKYSIIEEKFFAEENVVEKPRKNKGKKIAAESNNIDDDNKSTVSDDLRIRVKQEETSLVQTKEKKKKKTSNSHIENKSQSDSSIEPNRESIEKDLRVKQEQASVVEPEIVKSKKKKKQKRSTVSSDIEIASEAKSVTTISEVTVPDELSKLGEPSKYSIIEEKFFAEESVVEKPRKNKRKKNAAESNNIDDDNKAIYLKKNAEITLERDNDNLNNISLEPNGFTCNNIVSSTILNSSAIEFRDTKGSQNEELVKKSKNIQPRKISDRIRFEEDDNSIQQDPQFDKTSDKINRFLKVNPQLKPYIWETSKDGLITKDDEIWTLTWPHEINLEKLRNTTVSSDDKICKLKIEGQTYDGVLNQDVTAVTLFTHEHTQAFIKNIPVEECIDYHKRIPKVHIPHNIMVDNQRNFMPLPETKCRHPLFGAHYKKAIKISTAIVERLQAAKERHSETPSENIKKKKQKHKSADIKTEDCPYIKPEREAFRKNIKRKCSQENDGPPKKVKRVNENADSPAVWESEKAIEENLFNC